MHKPRPVKSIDNLRDRVDRLLKTPAKRSVRTQQTLNLNIQNSENIFTSPSKSITEFLNFMSDAVPEGEVYLFGGVLRDMALFGSKDFNSDIDIVVEGDWLNCVKYLESLDAVRNKFGGYRLDIGGWPIDIWNAKETWAIKNGLVQYTGISSLTNTTVLNWDAILMNWRTRSFIFRENYLESINSRLLDVVLVENPDPLGMAVRVFRHLCVKDARKVSRAAVDYLACSTKKYSFEEIKEREIRSYGNAMIAQPIYRYFEHVSDFDDLGLNTRISFASDILSLELGFTEKNE